MLYDENVKNGSNSDNTDTASNTDAVEIDYQKIEDSMYNSFSKALKEYNTQSSDNTKLSVSPSVSTDYVEFATSTDSKLYTCELSEGHASSVAVQEVAYLLDIRNILLIFLFIYFIFSMYGKLKSTLINYYERS